MKQIFTLIALMANMTLFAQINETFETNTLEQLQSNCWQFVGASRSNAAALTGTWGLEVVPATSNANTGNSNSGQIVTPFLNFTQAQTVSFNYRLSGSGGTRRAEIKLLDKFGVTSAIIATIPLTATTRTLASVNIPAGSGTKRLVIDIYGSGGGNVWQFIDDISISAPYHYTSICNLAPTAVDNSFNAGVRGTYFGSTVLNNDTDPNGETLVPSVVSSPQGTVEMNADGTFTFTPNTGFTGNTASFTYSVTDNGFTPLTATATVTINFPQQTITLPVKLKEFNGSLNNNKAKLTWSVEENESGNHFYIQRSEDGKSFSNAIMLMNSSKIGVEVYEFSEQLPFANGAYYRLKIVNNDQSVAYSNIVLLKAQNSPTANTTAIRVLQNPLIGNTIQLQVYTETDEIQTISLYDMSGTTLYTKQIRLQKGGNSLSVNLEKLLSKGTYLLETRSTTQRRVIKVTK